MIGELAALGAALCWTIAAILYRRAVLVVKPISANIVRCVCTSLIILSALALIGKFQVLTSLSAYAIALACVSGIVGLGLGDTLYMVSLRLIGVARAVPITCTYPLFSLLLAVFLQGQAVTLQVVLGAVAIAFGIWFLTREEKREGELRKVVLIRGAAAAVLTALVWSISIAMVDMAVTLPVTGSLDSALAVNTFRVVAVGAFLLVSAPIADRGLSFLRMPKKTVAVLILGGIVALALGWFFLAYSFLLIPEAQAVPLSSASPLFATASGLVFLNERLTAKDIAGSMIIVIGIFMIFMI
jgi:DME family drug/metabolite transporter